MTLALICGQGHLPRIVAGTQSRPPLVCVLRGFEPEYLPADVTFRLEQLGTFIADLKARGVTQVCLCGAIRRPPVDPTLIDAATAPLVPRLQRALTSGDDSALRIVMTLFEEAGLKIAPVHDLVADLIPEPGIYTLKAPRSGTDDEARLGQRTVAEMGARDVGQACVIRGSSVVAREDAAGTDAMLDRLAHGEGGILYKAPKPQQDRRADLPAIGPDTPERVAAAGLDGIVIASGGVLLLERAKTVARCDALGLFLWVRDAGV
ncbi:LpxI family protein [Marivita sp. S2033]|uniref:LpxI family protein n=1 Tax=Marivita sp. S2033 TaxID=3373187 RepID=UPI003982890D